MRLAGDVRAITVGDYAVSSLGDGGLRLDGGAIFGVVPKSVWSRRAPADEENRVPLALRPLLIEGRGRRILVETGLGDRHDAAFAARFAVDRSSRLLDNLAALGVAPESIDTVVNTHLHWDHAGGNLICIGHGADDGNGRGAAGAGLDSAARPAFPTARYVAQEIEWADANAPHERSRASYRPGDFAPLQAAGRLDLVAGDVALADGVYLERVGGHCRGLMVVRVTSRGETLLFPSDLVPSAAHLDYAWVMGYDLYPVEVLERKRELLGAAAREGWTLALYHDPAHAFGRVAIERTRGRERVIFEPIG